jgi:predicted O-methyltransferase YrrM
MRSFLDRCSHAPRVLEVGVCTGITFIPILAHLVSTRDEFVHFGVDIRVQDHVEIIRSYMIQKATQRAMLIAENSLVVLPKLVEHGCKFDLILLDGDHNYFTVANELPFVKQLLDSNGVMIIDDYMGRWAERDLWYAQRPGYEEIKAATTPVQTEKHGVKLAVDEFLAQNATWAAAQPIAGEPIVIGPNHVFL